MRWRRGERSESGEQERAEERESSEYDNDHKYVGRQARTNSVDSVQTAPGGKCLHLLDTSQDKRATLLNFCDKYSVSKCQDFYCKNQNIWTPEKFAVITLKFQQGGITIV